MSDSQEYLDLLRKQITAYEKAAALAEQEIEEKKRNRIAIERHTTIVRDVVARYANLAELIKEMMATNEEKIRTDKELTDQIKSLVETMAQHSLNATALHEWSEGFQKQIEDIRILLLTMGDSSRAIKKLKYDT